MSYERVINRLAHAQGLNWRNEPVEVTVRVIDLELGIRASVDMDVEAVYPVHAIRNRGWKAITERTAQ